MKLLPDYEHMDYRDVYTHCMYISLIVEHEGLCEWGSRWFTTVAMNPVWSIELKKKSLLHGFVYINNKMGKLHQSVFLVFTGEQEQLNIVSAMNPIGNREDCRYWCLSVVLLCCSTSSIQTYLGLMAAWYRALWWIAQCCGKYHFMPIPSHIKVGE